MRALAARSPPGLRARMSAIPEVVHASHEPRRQIDGRRVHGAGTEPPTTIRPNRSAYDLLARISAKPTGIWERHP